MVAPAPQDTDVNHAISLYRMGRYQEARTALDALVTRETANVTAWNVLGYLHRDIGETAAAGAAFDQALKLLPGNGIALKGRARVALERVESDFHERFSAALADSPGDPRLMLELTEARLAEGDAGAAPDFARFVAGLPEWTEGQIELARMLWETERDDHFTDHVRALLRAQPNRIDLWRSLALLLQGCGRHEAAADAARDAREATGQGEFALIEAINAGHAGDVARADALWPTIPAGLPGRAVQESVHQIRRGRLDLALAAIERGLAQDSSSVGAWAVAELIYRKLGHERSAWLSGRDRLIGRFELGLDASAFAAAKALLLRLHERSMQMVGQSVRAGTQTRGRLFDRTEPELEGLRRALDRALAEYVAGLPEEDALHPLLRHRSAPLTITGSWSVRLTGSGYHVSHMHPQGVISSACYFAVPDAASGSDQGRLQLGVPPPDLLLDLEPLETITPRAGELVLFPSYLHHGTTPFAAGERLTVAFDVNRHPAPAGLSASRLALIGSPA